MSTPFSYQGHQYHEGKPNYFYMDGGRISAAKFREAKRAMYAERKAAAERIGNKIRISEGTKEGTMNVIDVDGVQYANDWTAGKFYREGTEITRAEFDAAMGINRHPKSTTPQRRRPRDVAFECDAEGMHVTLTAKQLDFLQHMVGCPSWEADPGAAGIFVDQLQVEIGGMCEDRPMTTGAMITTLSEKALLEVSRYERTNLTSGRVQKVRTVELTTAGVEVLEQMGVI